MFCWKCGQPNDDDALFCSQCGVPLKPSTPATSPSAATAGTRRFAGFWLRFVAHMIDQLVISMVSVVLFLIGLVFSVGGLAAMPDLDDPDPAVLAGLVGGWVIITIILVVAQWLYYALMESSSQQATLGKLALSLRVTDLQGEQISFARATGRHFGKILSGMLLMIGYIMAGFTQNKQALHDLLAGTLVVRGRSNEYSI